MYPCVGTSTLWVMADECRAPRFRWVTGAAAFLNNTAYCQRLRCRSCLRAINTNGPHSPCLFWLSADAAHILHGPPCFIPQEFWICFLLYVCVKHFAYLPLFFFKWMSCVSWCIAGPVEMRTVCGAGCRFSFSFFVTGWVEDICGRHWARGCEHVPRCIRKYMALQVPACVCVCVCVKERKVRTAIYIYDCSFFYMSTIQRTEIIKITHPVWTTT